MEARPLAQQLRHRPRIGELVGGRTRPMIGRDIADAVAGGLDGMHLDLGKRRRECRRVSSSLIQLNWMFWRVVKWP